MGSSVIDCIGAASYCKSPWPHLQFDSFLPAFMAQEIADKWPTEGFRYLKHSDSVLPNGTSRRLYQPLAERFQDIAEQVLSVGAQQAMKVMLQVSGELYPQAILVEDAPGYWIRRHTDCAGKVISSQCYFAEDDLHEEQGVCLEGNSVKQIPYGFNTGYAFKVTNGSWHRVRPSATRRRSLQVIYYDHPNPTI